MQNSSIRSYVFCFTATCIFCLGLFLYRPHQDHIGAIALKGDQKWYLNFRNSKSMLLQDRDIFYHGIGKSIHYVKKADIVILGHSMVLFGLDWKMLQDFGKRWHIKIYNMAFASDISGEFSLRVIKKYHLKPAIWVLNADDTAGSFFDVQLWDVTKDILAYNRLQAYKNVISKNMKWQQELAFKKIMPTTIFDKLYAKEFVSTYRSVKHGNWFNDDWPKFWEKNASFINQREPNCHAKPEEFNLADNFIKRFEGGDVILTLVPYAASCRPRVREIAKHLKVPFISVGWRGMSTWDGNAHLDGEGARKFTAEFLHQLEQTPSFKKLVAERNQTQGV